MRGILNQSVIVTLMAKDYIITCLVLNAGDIIRPW